MILCSRVVGTSERTKHSPEILSQQKGVAVPGKMDQSPVVEYDIELLGIA